MSKGNLFSSAAVLCLSVALLLLGASHYRLSRAHAELTQRTLANAALQRIAVKDCHRHQWMVQQVLHENGIDFVTSQSPPESVTVSPEDLDELALLVEGDDSKPYSRRYAAFEAIRNGNNYDSVDWESLGEKLDAMDAQSATE